MMANTISGLTNYYSTFMSPVSSYQVNPVTNLMYSSIVSKAYSQTFAKKAQGSMSSYLTGLSSKVNDLKNSAKPFTTRGMDASFDKKSVSASDSSAVTGTAASNADNTSYILNISKLATAQVNSGAKLNSNDKSAMASGTNTISLKVGNNEAKNISFTIDENDTNKLSLEKMAKAINYVKTGVSASVVSDSKTGTSYLKLTSDKTGTDNAFSISDVSGNAVAASGAASTTGQAQNAEYTLDGKQYTSQENTIKLNNDKVKVTLNKAESKDISLKVGTDTEGIKSDIKDFVKNYNNLVNFANSSSTNFRGAADLSRELGNIAKSRKSSLEGMGITANSDGTLSINEKKLDKTVDTELWRVKSTFEGKTGIAESVYKKSNEVLSSPVKYAKPEEFKRDFSSFYNYMSTANHMPYGQNMYNGMVVDMLL